MKSISFIAAGVLAIAMVYGGAYLYFCVPMRPHGECGQMVYRWQIRSNRILTIKRAGYAHPRSSFQPTDVVAEYRVGGEFAGTLFWPAHRLDRDIRPHYWTVDSFVTELWDLGVSR